jgi:TRAP-type C4-dicarboxylate transport system permease small subunit
MDKPSLARKLYDHFEEVFSVVCIGTMVVCLFLQVGMRWTTGAGIPWSEELSRFAFLWAVFSAAPVLAKHGGHVRITAQFLLMPPKYRLGFRFCADILWIASNFLIAWWCWEVVRSGLEYPELSPTLNIVRGYVELIIPISFLLMNWRIAEGYIIRWRQGTLLDLVLEQSEKVEA